MENAQQTEEAITFTATYSPEDNKIRLYASKRLDKELYNRVREAGFIWAPKQELFVAPMWTPSRFDLAVELAGFVDDEETTLEERAAIRAERFEGYQAKRAQDAERSLNEYENLSDGSGVVAASDNWRQQRRAEKKAQRIENAKDHAIKMWETSEYWESRTAGVLSHAAGRNNTRTLLNRIKKLTAGKRKQEKYIKEATKIIELWTTDQHWKTKDGILTLSKALTVANSFDHSTYYFKKDKYQKSDYEGATSLYSGLKNEVITPEEARDLSLPRQYSQIAYAERWLKHYELRLTYENAILKASGYVEPEKPKAPPMINIDEPLTINKLYSRSNETEVLPVHHMTKAEYKKVYSKGCIVSACGTYRQKTAPVRIGDEPHYMAKRHVIFLTDSKEHKKP